MKNFFNNSPKPNYGLLISGIVYVFVGLTIINQSIIQLTIIGVGILLIIISFLFGP